MLNNCQARFDWCVKSYREANHHPVAALDGDLSDTIVRMKGAPGRTLRLDASASTDPDGDPLAFSWFIYPEAGTYKGEITIRDAAKRVAFVPLPAEAAGRQIHVILQVVDENKIVPLYDYRRIVIDVAPS
jgi:hypothetical protein